MYNPIEKIFAIIKITPEDISSIPKNELESIIKHKLARILSEYIVEHMEELPVVLEKAPQISTFFDHGEIHEIRVNLISDEELKRLKNIEYEYSKIMRKQEELIRRRNEPITGNGGWLGKPLTGEEDFLIDKSSTLPGLNNLGKGY
jgi:hypothetical protein